jgi:hypothetical protein
MVSYDEVKTEINTNWGLTPGQANPTIHNKDERYSTAYPDTLFLKMYKEMPIKEISKDDAFSRRQFFRVEGVYTTYALAKTALQEITRIITAHKGWRLGGKTDILQTRKRHVFRLKCYEIAYLRGGEW